MSRHGGREGHIFGSYRLLRFLGQGGFGEVYLAEHIYLQTSVAVKLLNREEDQRIRDLIRAEARTSAQLEHPHIVRVLDFGFEGDIPYLVMTYAPHGTLRTLHPRGTMLSPQRVAFYVRQIASALQYAHDHKVVHRDVKPENMLLAASNQVLLSDFGLAIAAHRAQSLSSQDAMGTVAYMAPEQAEGKADAASDQYALAVCVYEWLSGHLPFTGNSPVEIALKHQREHIPPLRANTPSLLSSQLPPLQKVLMKALNKDPRARFSTVLAFAEALQDASEEAETHQGSTFISYRGHVDYVTTLAWSPDGQWIASGSADGTVQIWSASTGQTSQTYLGHQGAINTLAWSPDGTDIVSGSEDSTAHLWHAQTGVLRLIYRGHAHAVDAVSWSPDGIRIASGSGDGTIQIWDATTGTHHLTYRGHVPVNSEDRYILHALAWSPSGFYLASASEDGTTQVWDAATGKQLQVFRDQDRGRRGDMESVAWLRKGTALLTVGNWTIQLYDPMSGKLLLTYVPPKKTILGKAAPSPNGQYVASVEGGEAIRIWHTETGEQYFPYRGHSKCWSAALAWSPHGTHIASCAGKEVYVWQAI